MHFSWIKQFYKVPTIQEIIISRTWIWLRRNPLISSSKCTKTLYRDNLQRVIFNCLLWKSQFLTLNIKCRKQILNFIWNWLQSAGKMKLMMNFDLWLHNFSELRNYFIDFPWEIDGFRCYLRQLFLFLQMSIWKIIYVSCGERYEFMIDIGVVNIKPIKKLRPERDSNHDLCDTSAVLYQLRYQAIWELVTLYVCDM